MTSLRYGVTAGEELVSDRDKNRREEQRRADNRARDRVRGQKRNFTFSEATTAEQTNALFDLVQVQTNQIENLKAQVRGLYSKASELSTETDRHKAYIRDADAGFQKLRSDFDRFVGYSAIAVILTLVSLSFYFFLRYLY